MSDDKTKITEEIDKMLDDMDREENKVFRVFNLALVALCVLTLANFVWPAKCDVCGHFTMNANREHGVCGKCWNTAIKELLIKTEEKDAGDATEHNP